MNAMPMVGAFLPLAIILTLASCERAGVVKGPPSVAMMDDPKRTQPGVPNKESMEPNRGDSVVVPVVQEEVDVLTRKVETGRVRVKKTVHERDVMVDAPIVQEELNIERVPINRFIEEPVAVRYEGETVIIPVVEEVPVVVKRLRLKEEWHVTKRHITTPQSHPVHLRREEVTIERVEPHSASPVRDSGSTQGDQSHTR